MSTDHPPALAAFADQLTSSRAAQRIYRAYQNARIGSGDLKLHDWPGLPVDLTENNAILGWSASSVVDLLEHGPILTAPYNSEHPAGHWLGPTMTFSAVACQEPGPPGTRHPSPACRCGLRLMQSWPVLKAFMLDQHDRLGPDLLIAPVKAFGLVQPGAPDDDWQYTARAQHLTIVGVGFVADALLQHADALTARYGVRINSWEIGDHGRR